MNADRRRLVLGSLAAGVLPLSGLRPALAQGYPD